MKLRPIVFIIFLAGMASCAKQPASPPDPLKGAWRLVSMHLNLADGRDVEFPAHESLFLFADGYYSIGYAFGDSSAPYAERWHPNDSEKIARFGSVIVNSGTYQLRGSHLDVRPLFALAPEFVGGKGVFSFAFTADTLELNWENSIAFDGLEYPSRGAVTHLRLVRID